MIGRLTDDGTLRFGKAVPRRRDTIDLSFLAVTLPPRGRRSIGSWRNWCGDYRSPSTSCETVGSIQLLPRAGLSLPVRAAASVRPQGFPW